jgi:hypothetical protein
MLINLCSSVANQVPDKRKLKTKKNECDITLLSERYLSSQGAVTFECREMVEL